jgi:hypothetical protein
MLVLSILDVIHTMADDFRVLDLFDPRVRVTNANVAHDSKEDEKEDGEKPKTFAVEATKDGESKVFEFDIWDIAKYIAIAVGGGYVIHKIFSRKQQQKDEGPNSQQMMMTMMFMMYQTNMMIMQNLAPKKEVVPSIVPTNANPSAKPLLVEEDGKDWMQFFEENKGKVLSQDQLTQLDKMGIKQNWKVERDLRGTILNVWKVNEYLK